jgi:nicotinate dehydrogenase subunit B
MTGAATGRLAVVRGTMAPETFLVLDAAGGITAFNGHVDLGTGIGTALAQIVAEELDIPAARVTMVLGDSARVPDQGATIASETIQVAAIPLRQAAAQARRHLLHEAARRLDTPADALVIEDGVVSIPATNRAISYAELLTGQDVILPLDEQVPVKPTAAYRIVGQSVARADIPAKATGQFVYVHDVRVPGMLHGRVIRPPYAGVDAGPFVGTSLLAVDDAAVRRLPGVVDVVVIGDFIGVVAEREEQAQAAADALRATWKPTPRLDLGDLETALRDNPSTRRLLESHGDIDTALDGSAIRLQRSYLWPYQLHGAIGPSCALADWRPDALTVWSGTQNPFPLRADLAGLLAMPEAAISVVRLEAAGCYGRNCADDVTADAALLSRAVGRPVRVQLTRAQEHVWEPKGSAQLIDVAGGLTAGGEVTGYDFAVRYPSNAAPLLASLLTGAIAPVATISRMGDRTAVPPYDYPARRIVAHDMPPIVRASWLRGVSALPNSFAHECFIDELASEAGIDPVAFRLRYLTDERAAALVRQVADRAGWQPHTTPGTAGRDGDILRGRGFAYAVYRHGDFPGTSAAWSAWVADVAVNQATGEVAVTRVVVGQDSGLMINPAGVTHQIHGNVIQSTSRALMEEASFTAGAPTSREWGGYPIITFPDVPPIDVLLVPRPDQPPLGVGESASVPSAAAIANAIYDATGVRFREVPFTPDRILAGLGRTPLHSEPAPTKPARKPGRRRLPSIAGAFAAGVAACAAFVPWRGEIAPIARPDPAIYAQATIARGAELAALGDCAVCHTGPDGARYAGGHPLATPFGTILGANLTPDVTTGIGAWSYPAFERAMREGISRDGTHLYPAFPYTHFTRATDADLQALYAFLMAQPAVTSPVPRTNLKMPFARPLMAAWNALFHRPGVDTPNQARSAEWNRGAYLVEGLGHCAACHSPRNALGATRTGDAHLAGGLVDGWEAPPLTALSHAPLAWTEEDFFTYLRTGFSPRHGVAAGPMAPVIHELAGAPDADIRAMSVYLADLAARPDPTATTTLEAAAEARRKPLATTPAGRLGARLFDGACAVCHAGDGPLLLGVRPSLALNSNLHSASPDNLIRVILNGASLGAMPAFAASLDDTQISALVAYLRGVYAADKPAWTDINARVSALRAEQ